MHSKNKSNNNKNNNLHKVQVKRSLKLKLNGSERVLFALATFLFNEVVDVACLCALRFFLFSFLLLLPHIVANGICLFVCQLMRSKCSAVAHSNNLPLNYLASHEWH